jgi:hypothetical protein
LKKVVQDFEDKARRTKRTINDLCDHAGKAPVYPEAEFATTAHASSGRKDRYYGRGISTAIQMFLAERDAEGLGPVSASDIYGALKDGGFMFGTEDPENAKRGIRVCLTKNSKIFHKLPQGDYGLLAWYPDAKEAKGQKIGSGGGEDEPKPRKAKPRAERPGRRVTSGSRPTLPDAIGTVLSAAAGAMTVPEIVAAVRATGFISAAKRPDSVVRSTLKRVAEKRGWTRTGKKWSKTKEA